MILPQLDFLQKERYFASIYVRNDLCLYVYNKVVIEVKQDHTNSNALSSELIKQLLYNIIINSCKLLICTGTSSGFSALKGLK